MTTVVTETDAGTASPTTTTTAAPTTITGTVPVTRNPSDGAQLTITDIRVGSHDGFDRVVFEFAGSGTPGWHADYTDDPAQPGSGFPIDVPGHSVLAVFISGLQMPTESPHPSYTGPNPVPGTGVITEVSDAGWFEGQSDTFIGLTADRPAVDISVLSGPTRLVIDVAH
ncbi:hypothetical protein [Gordonia sp. (in: high G+C Gram-positive bacteria)]|uniref:AMIN-like domain-containing (lipo)protein n=1 Tax=Gordonia sp. (in: high G+C Gram-positive bacteria) TaxID=84139 RepID=UPI0025C2A5E7|nr:hypothetical protein [Gordonia sp. (in: high G+C Gram-positive bacteria)]